jgi:hypothetical protein
MTDHPLSAPFAVGPVVRIRHSGFKRVRKKPSPAFIELLQSQREAIPPLETGSSPLDTDAS